MNRLIANLWQMLGMAFAFWSPERMAPAPFIAGLMFCMAMVIVYHVAAEKETKP